MKTLLVFLSLVSILSFAQDTQEKSYDEKIYLYQKIYVTENNVSKDDYLKFTKPLSKWDSRPLDKAEVFIMGELQPSSVVPNYIWGSFSRYYKVNIDDALALPHIFIMDAIDDSSKYIKDFSSARENYERLINRILSLNKKIYVIQKNLKRVDDIFFEDGKYWSYVIPDDSPFPMSDSVRIVKDHEYTETETEILNTLEELGLYAVYNDETAIYLLVDGLFDNSFGYIYEKKPDVFKLNHLFEINFKSRISTQYYFYVSN